MHILIGRIAATVAIGAVVAIAPSSSTLAETALSPLAGTWSGSGQVKLSDGSTERLTCRAFYTPRDDGTNMGLALRCASTSYRIELRSTVQLSGSRVSGTWEERSFNASGTISGNAIPGSLTMSFTGTTTGTMVVTTSGSTQRVAITGSGEGGSFTNVTLTLTKG